MVLVAAEIKVALYIFILLILVGIIFLGAYNYYKKEALKEKSKISFKEGLDLTELPIATFYSNNQKLHFLLDTGSNISYINEDIVKNLPHKQTDKTTHTIGFDGNGTDTIHCLLDIGYKDQVFTEEFGIVNLTDAFKQIEDETGIKLHGILGSKFFEKYKYILDFRDLIAYR